VLLVVRRPENRIGWLFLLVGLTLGVGQFTAAYATHAPIADPGSLPGGSWPGTSRTSSGRSRSSPSCCCSVVPAGEVPSSRWRWIERAGFAALGVLFVVSVIGAMFTWSKPLSGPDARRDPGLGSRRRFLFGVIALPCIILASFVSAVVRFRRSRGDERLQLKWFATGAAFTAVVFAISIPLGGNNPVLSILLDVGLAFVLLSIAPAILKYRLYEIDVVIGRAVVFATLAAFITVVYVALVVGVGTLVGNRQSPLLSAVAAALVAVAFQPVRQRARRLANRVVYGKRATPYEPLGRRIRRDQTLGFLARSGSERDQTARTIGERTTDVLTQSEITPVRCVRRRDGSDRVWLGLHRVEEDDLQRATTSSLITSASSTRPAGDA
jgi:hypothetical protein